MLLTIGKKKKNPIPFRGMIYQGNIMEHEERWGKGEFNVIDDVLYKRECE